MKSLHKHISNLKFTRTMTFSTFFSEYKIESMSFYRLHFVSTPSSDGMGAIVAIVAKSKCKCHNFIYNAFFTHNVNISQ